MEEGGGKVCCLIGDLGIRNRMGRLYNIGRWVGRVFWGTVTCSVGIRIRIVLVMVINSTKSIEPPMGISLMVLSTDQGNR